VKALEISAVTVAISDLRSVSVGYFILKTAAYGRFQFSWFKVLITRTAHSEN